MRDKYAPSEARFLIHLGMTDADYTEDFLEVGEIERRDEHEYIYLYFDDLSSVLTALTCLVPLNHVVDCTVFERSAVSVRSSGNTTFWSWME